MLMKIERGIVHKTVCMLSAQQRIHLVDESLQVPEVGNVVPDILAIAQLRRRLLKRLFISSDYDDLRATILSFSGDMETDTSRPSDNNDPLSLQPFRISRESNLGRYLNNGNTLIQPLE